MRPLNQELVERLASQAQAQKDWCRYRHAILLSGGASAHIEHPHPNIDVTRRKCSLGPSELRFRSLPSPRRELKVSATTLYFRPKIDTPEEKFLGSKQFYTSRVPLVYVDAVSIVVGDCAFGDVVGYAVDFQAWPGCSISASFLSWSLSHSSLNSDGPSALLLSVGRCVGS